MKYLFTVEKSIELPELGCVIGTFVPNKNEFPSLGVGTLLTLELPNGEIIDTHAECFPMVNIGSIPEYFHFTIQLPKGISAEEIPEQTKVYSRNK